ncbi:MAG: FtsQ-type POTRA domain-containing protein [Dysosmobacter sp.]
MLVICGAIVAALTLFFRVDTIVVTGTQRYTQQEVIDATRRQTGDNLFLLNKYAVAQHIHGAALHRGDPHQPQAAGHAAHRGGGVRHAPGGGAGRQRVADQPPAARSWSRRTAAEAEDYAVIDGCELLAPSVGSSIALATEYATQQQPAGAAGGAGGNGAHGAGGCHPPGGCLHAGHGLCRTALPWRCPTGRITTGV